ncbi:MAG: DMT family transporter [Aestuariivita sp.]|nr:DMT family transporter [Aestuariivita sp.]MCY4203209.1 DMT family transporter [Aestuariivita sp.]
MAHYASIMLIAGIGIPILAALNAALGKYLSSPTSAAAITFFIACFTCLVAMMATGPAQFNSILSAPRQYFVAGLLMAFYLLSITYIAPHFGVGNAIFYILIGQLISAAMIDHFGLFGAQISELDLKRTCGIVLMALGVWMARQS